MNWLVDRHKMRMPAQDEILPGRAEAMRVPERHAVLSSSIRPPYPAGSEIAGCPVRLNTGVYGVKRPARSTATGAGLP